MGPCPLSLGCALKYLGVTGCLQPPSRGSETHTHIFRKRQEANVANADSWRIETMDTQVLTAPELRLSFQDKKLEGSCGLISPPPVCTPSRHQKS